MAFMSPTGRYSATTSTPLWRERIQSRSPAEYKASPFVWLEISTKHSVALAQYSRTDTICEPSGRLGKSATVWRTYSEMHVDTVRRCLRCTSMHFHQLPTSTVGDRNLRWARLFRVAVESRWLIPSLGYVGRAGGAKVCSTRRPHRALGGAEAFETPEFPIQKYHRLLRRWLRSVCPAGIQREQVAACILTDLENN